MPAIIRFLGQEHSFQKPKSLAERLLAKRRAMGWSIKEAARLGATRLIDNIEI